MRNTPDANDIFLPYIHRCLTLVSEVPESIKVIIPVVFLVLVLPRWLVNIKKLEFGYVIRIEPRANITSRSFTGYLIDLPDKT